MRPLILVSFFLVISLFQHLQAQTDSVVFINNNYMVGEVKAMDRGVLTMKTNYSDSDFKIKWDGIQEIFTQSRFLITLSDGTRYNGRLESKGQGKVLLIIENQNIEVDLSTIVFLQTVDDGFGSRLSASIDLSSSVTKSQSLRQLQVRSNVGYTAERWLAESSYNRLLSNQDDVTNTDRTDANLNFNYFLPKYWYIPIKISFLSNTEQRLRLRTTGQFGAGKYVTRTNQSYWGFSAGLSFNNENFSSDEPTRQSLEGFVGSELNLYKIGDLNLLTRVVAFPSFTESGRLRMDFVFDAKYDLPLDFYIKTGITLNYDNQPVEGASDVDYIFQTGFGWEW